MVPNFKLLEKEIKEEMRLLKYSVCEDYWGQWRDRIRNEDIFKSVKEDRAWRN